MKVWVQSFNYAPHDLGGSERSAREIAVGLRARGHMVEVLVSDGSKPYPDAVDGIPVRVVDGVRIGKSPLWPDRTFAQRMAWNLRSEIDPVLLARLVAEIRKGRPDCILMNNPAGHGSALMLAARMVGVPVLPVIRDYGWFCAFGVMHRNEQNCRDLCTSCRLFSAARRRLLRDQPCIAISTFVADLIERFAPRARVEIIHNSVPEAFISTPRPIRAAGGALRFGYLGRLHPTKGVDRLIDGWIASGVFNKGHRLLLAGDNQGVELPADPGGSGIEIVGRKPAIAFLDDLDVLVVPSLWGEPFGRTVIEGLARGLYVIGAPNGAIPSLIPDQHGEVLSDVTAGTISTVIQRLVGDPTPVLALRERDVSGVMEQYRQQTMIDRYEAAIAGAIAAHDRGGVMR